MLYVLYISYFAKFMKQAQACEYNCCSKLYSVKEEYEVDYNIHANSFNNFKERMQFNVNQPTTLSAIATLIPSALDL